MDELLNFLNAHDNWQELLSAEPYCVKVNEDHGLFILKYDQIHSDFAYELVRQCRGCIVAKGLDGWEYVCRPFTKFFNAEEPHAAAIDWSTASVQEKIDGSLIKFYYYENAWRIATNGTIDAFKAETGNSMYPTFGDLVILAISNLGFTFEEFTELMSEHATYMFELTSPFNQVVLRYDTTKLWFLGWCDVVGLELKSEWSDMYTICDHPKRYPLTTYDDVRAAANALGSDGEGFVVVDDHFNRVKIKSPWYITAHKLKNNGIVTDESLMDLILTNEVDEFLAYCPEYTQRIATLAGYRKNLAVIAVNNIGLIKGQEYEYLTRGDYAREVIKYDKPIQDFLFHCFDERIFYDYAHDWSAEKWIKAFKGMGWLND